jgi:signal transduction histidine kinase
MCLPPSDQALPLRWVGYTTGSLKRSTRQRRCVTRRRPRAPATYAEFVGNVAAYSVAVFPAQRQMLRGLVIARWAALAWMAGQLVVARSADADSVDHLVHPFVAVAVFAMVALLNTVFTVALRTDVRQLLLARFAILELTVAFGLYVADGWVFARGHVFTSQLALASSWPLVAVLSVAIVHGHRVGFVAGAFVPTGRIVGAQISGASLWTQNHVLSFASSIVFYAVAGGVIGLIARQLRNVENENAERRARDEVGRQLHDGVLQTLALVERRTASSDPELARLARRSDHELRQWLWGATTSGSDDDVVAAVKTIAHAVAARSGMVVSVSAVGEPDDVAAVPPAVGGALAAATGEVVANVAKHAGVMAAVIFVDVDGAGVSVSVSDQGVGMPIGAVEGDGLRRSVRERVADVGGTVSISSMPGNGTEVVLRWSK